MTYILPADYAICAKPAGFLLPKIKKGATTHAKEKTTADNLGM